MVLPSSIETAKAELRRVALVRRDSLSPQLRAAAAAAIAEFAPRVTLSPGAIVSGYSPLKSEINPLPLMRRLAERGAQLALPVVNGRGQPLTMRAWSFGEALDSGMWGIREPKTESPEVFPDVLLVPLLAFDRIGYRIGYGAGYYDMTLNRLRTAKTIVAIGMAFAAQEVEEVPNTPRDARLDLVLTEQDMIDCRKG
jgi:5-formyltetrahydrofolate cyclo-ligase